MQKFTVRTIVKYFVFLVMDAWIAYRHERKLLQKARRLEFKQIIRDMKHFYSYSYSDDIWDDEDDIRVAGFDSYQDLVDAYHKQKSDSSDRESSDITN